MQRDDLSRIRGWTTRWQCTRTTAIQRLKDLEQATGETILYRQGKGKAFLVDGKAATKLLTPSLHDEMRRMDREMSRLRAEIQRLKARLSRAEHIQKITG